MSESKGWIKVGSIEYKLAKGRTAPDKASSYEKEVSAYFTTLGITLHREVLVKGCLGLPGPRGKRRHLIFDFLFIDRGQSKTGKEEERPVLVEIDGEQHFSYIKRYYDSLNDLYRQQRHDGIKNDFTKDKVSFLRISFSSLPALQEILTSFVKEMLENRKPVQRFQGEEYKGKWTVGACAASVKDFLTVYNKRCLDCKTDISCSEDHIKYCAPCYKALKKCIDCGSVLLDKRNYIIRCIDCFKASKARGKRAQK